MPQFISKIKRLYYSSRFYSGYAERGKVGGAALTAFI
jgi:hypothetical protein